MNYELEERRRYVTAFNSTMVKIWKEKITMLGLVDTGNLYRSVAAVSMQADGKFTDITLRQGFAEYGLYVDRGTGKSTPKGNPGDLGHANNRRRTLWFSRKYYASVKNIQEFMADSLGREAAAVLSFAEKG